MTQPRWNSRFLTLTFAALAGILAVLCSSAPASAQVRVLASAGVESNAGVASDVEFVSARPGVQVHAITGRSRAVAYGRGGASVAHGVSSSFLCETPCRLRLDRPVELGIPGASSIINPNGAPMRYVVTPVRMGLRLLSYFSMIIGGTSAVSAGVVLPLLEPEFNTPGVRRILWGALGGGLIVTVLSIVGFIRSRGRFERIDALTF